MVQHQVVSDRKLNESINWKRLSVCLVFPFALLSRLSIYSIAVIFCCLENYRTSSWMDWFMTNTKSPFDPEVYHQLPSTIETRVKLTIQLKMNLKMCCLRTLWNVSQEYQVQYGLNGFIRFGYALYISFAMHR